MSDKPYGESPTLRTMSEHRRALHEIAMGPMRKKWPAETMKLIEAKEAEDYGRKKSQDQA